MQVRDLRMSLALSLPKFMGTGIARQGAAIGESISPTMGPSQAVHLMATLIDQKFHNPLFQATPEEWDQVSHQKFIDEVQASQERLARARANPGPPTGTLRAGAYPAEKRRQLEESLGRSISALTLTDGLNLIDQAFAKLGID
jgi:hypothetical protein